VRTLLAASLALGLAAFAQPLPASAADFHLTVGPDQPDYWRSDEDREHAWRRRQEWREAQREDWRHGHCVRDWRNEVYCR
jgi:hypothetical protein